MAKLAFLGLGVMGYPMAGHLQAAGHDVCVYNRTAAKAQAWVDQHGGRAAPTPREAAEGADFVMTCVGNDDDLRGVCLGEDGAFAGMKPGAILVDHTTVSAKVTQELAAAAREAGGLGFVDAPISGGQAGAENGQLSVMCGGAQADYDAAEPVMNTYAKLCRRIGDSGAGQMTKMCNQIAIAGWCRPCPRRCIRRKGGARRARGGRGDQPGRRRIVADVQPYETMLDDHSSTVLPSTGCARTWASAWTPPMRTAPRCR